MKNILYALLAVALLISCERDRSLPNIVIIMADDLGYGDLSCFGNQSIRTPNIDQLAAEGVRFTDFHSNGAVCSPTRAALLTGRYQQRTGVEGVITAKSHREVGMPLEEITMAEELKKYNYRCAMFGKWHLGYSKAYNPLLQGFDEFVGFVSGNVDYHAHIDQEGFLDWWKGDELEDETGYSTDLITDYAVNYIAENNPANTDQPFFLYVAHEAPHYPYQRRHGKGFREVGLAKARADDVDNIPSVYKEMVEVMDEGIGRVMKALKDQGQYQNTIIIFLSDNGASPQGSNGILRGHKGGAYEGGSRVPAIISYPGQIGKGNISDQTILTMDLLPTVLDVIGQKPAGALIDGISIKDHLIEQTVLPERDVFFSFKNRSFIRSGNWKLVHLEDADGDRLELYDLSNDVGERRDLSAQNAELVKLLHTKLNAWKQEVRSGVKTVSQ